MAEPTDAVEATVLELLPNAGFRLELDSREQVIAHAAAATAANFVRLRPKDRVLVRLSPHDRTRGRIIGLLKKS
ncbi:MAG: translation initiation factor IF-1 [Bryobacteraceae bacterium]